MSKENKRFPYLYLRSVSGVFRVEVNGDMKNKKSGELDMKGKSVADLEEWLERSDEEKRVMNGESDSVLERVMKVTCLNEECRYEVGVFYDKSVNKMTVGEELSLL